MAEGSGLDPQTSERGSQDLAGPARHLPNLPSVKMVQWEGFEPSVRITSLA